jgi:hypothetical protein
MSIFLHEVSFPSRPPDISRIAEEIRAGSGLEVSFTESSTVEKGGLYDLHAELAFACAPEERIAVYTLRPGTVADRYKIAFADDSTRPARLPEPPAKASNRGPEADGRQVVYLKGLWKNDPTLLFAAQLALERLGGKAFFPLSDQQRTHYDRAVTVTELAERRRQHRVRWKLNGVLSILLLPIRIPWMLLKWTVIALIHGAWKLGRAAKGTGE